jgi:hypothetical protein
MKKLLALVLVAVMVLSVLPMSFAADVPAELAEATNQGVWPLPAGQYDPTLDTVSLKAGVTVFALFEMDMMYTLTKSIPIPDSIAGYTKVDKAADVGAGQWAVVVSMDIYNYVILGEPAAAVPDPQPIPAPDPDDDTSAPDTQPIPAPGDKTVDLQDQTVTFGTTVLLGETVQSFTDKDGVVFVKFKDVIALYNKALPLALGYEYKDGVAIFRLGDPDPIKVLDPAVEAETGDVTVSTSKFQFPAGDKPIPAYAYKIPGETNAQNWIPADSGYYA